MPQRDEHRIYPSAHQHVPQQQHQHVPQHQPAPYRPLTPDNHYNPVSVPSSQHEIESYLDGWTNSAGSAFGGFAIPSIHTPTSISGNSRWSSFTASPFAPKPKVGVKAPVDAYHQLKLSIEVARHGERTPGTPYIEDVQKTQYTEPEKDITKVGAEGLYALGHQLRHFAKNSQHWINCLEYDPAEVYALATFKDRARDSATAQLMGLYGKAFEFPLTDIEQSGYEVSLPTQADDFILRVDDDSCTRIADVETAIEDNLGTLALKTKVLAKAEQDGLFDWIRTETGTTTTDEGELEDYVDYILWAQLNKRELLFDVPEKFQMLLEMVDNYGNYEDIADEVELQMLKTWDL